MYPISIYYSKTAYRFGLLAAFLICCTGIALLTVIQNGAWDFSVHLFSKYGSLGILLMIGSVLLGRVYLKKLSITAPAIIVDSEGITLNNEEQQKISWGEIDHIEVLEVVSRSASDTPTKDKFIVPVLKNPEAHFNSATKKILGALDQFNVEAHASQPIRISTTFLKCSFDELKDILETGLNEYNAKRLLKTEA
jgi:hypothetical protein